MKSRACKYIYPDHGDGLTVSLIDNVEPYKGFWGHNEDIILNEINEYIKGNINADDSFFLDAGCGNGRLLKKFGINFSNIVAIEPDENRLKEAIENIKFTDFYSKVTFLNVSAEELTCTHKFDVILSSHVLQHVHTDTVIKILKNITSLLRNNGVLFLMTCHTVETDDCYAKDQYIDSKFIEENITKEDFNSLIFNNINVLPIHFFSKKTIIGLLKEAGFEIFDMEVFHNNRDIYLSARCNHSVNPVREQEMAVLAQP